MPAGAVGRGQLFSGISLRIQQRGHEDHLTRAKAWLCDLHGQFTNGQRLRHPAIVASIHPVGLGRPAPDHDVLLVSQTPTGTPVQQAFAITPEEHVCAAREQACDGPVVGEQGVGQGHVAGHKQGEELPEQGGLAGLLAGIAAQRHIQHRAAG